MSQHDYIIDNAAGAAFRSDLNNALAAIVSQNSEATEPATTYAYQFWADTTTGLLKQRNAANSAWITLMTLSTGVMAANAALAGSASQDFSAKKLTLGAGALIESEGAAVASAATCNIWAGDGNTVHITGTTTITSFGTAPQAGAWMKVVFDGALTLTNGANLALPGGANITTAAGDWAFIYADTTTQLDVLYFRKDGTAVVAAALTDQCVAWVNFNGTGTVAIRASYNVSSITDNGAGDYTVNFTTALADANYSALCGQSAQAAANSGASMCIAGTQAGGATTKTTAALRVNCFVNTTTKGDYAECDVAVFR